MQLPPDDAECGMSSTLLRSAAPGRRLSRPFGAAVVTPQGHPVIRLAPDDEGGDSSDPQWGQSERPRAHSFADLRPVEKRCIAVMLMLRVVAGEKVANVARKGGVGFGPGSEARRAEDASGPVPGGDVGDTATPPSKQIGRSPATGIRTIPEPGYLTRIPTSDQAADEAEGGS